MQSALACIEGDRKGQGQPLASAVCEGKLEEASTVMEELVDAAADIMSVELTRRESFRQAG